MLDKKPGSFKFSVSNKLNAEYSPVDIIRTKSERAIL